MRLAAFTAPPVAAPMDEPVVRVLVRRTRRARSVSRVRSFQLARRRAQMDDGESYLTHEMEAGPGDGRLPQLTFTTNKERAKLFKVTDWDESSYDAPLPPSSPSFAFLPPSLPPSLPPFLCLSCLHSVSEGRTCRRTFGLRCDLGFLTNAEGEVRAGAQKKGKRETWIAISNGTMSNQEQYLAGYQEVWSASMRNDAFTGVPAPYNIAPPPPSF